MHLFYIYQQKASINPLFHINIPIVLVWVIHVNDILILHVLGKEQTKTATELAYAEVISYNRKNLERELQNESRQQNRQQSRTKRRAEEI